MGPFIYVSLETNKTGEFMRSDEALYTEIHEAIVFDDDEEKALELLKKGIEDNVIDVNETDEEGSSLLSHADAAVMDDVCALLKENGATE